MAESEIVPNRHVFLSIVGRETKKKVDKYSQSGYCSSIIFYFNNFSVTKMNFKNHRQEVERVAESGKVPNRHVFDSIFGREIEEKVENAVPW